MTDAYHPRRMNVRYMDPSLRLDRFDIRTSTIHGTGAFAAEPIPAGERLMEYVGRLIDKPESLRQCRGANAYVFCLNATWDLDGNVPWNPARFVNHGCDPNCEAEQDEEDRVWIVSRRPILPGEELTYNYGYDLDEYRDYPCLCGQGSCLGFMVAEEYFPVVRRALERHREIPASPDLARAESR